MKITDLARAIAPKCRFEDIGIRPGEKLHEVMICEDDARITMEFENYFVIGWNGHHKSADGKGCSLDFRYGSDTNDQWLTADQLKQYVEQFIKEHPEYAHYA